MKKTGKTRKKLTPFFIAFLAVALVFLALGLGTLGSFRTTGDDFELRAPVTDGNGERQTSTVVFRLESSVSETYTDAEGKEQTRSVSLLIDDVYLFVNAVYAEAGVPAGVSVRRSSSSDDYFGGQVTGSVENLFTETQNTEEGTEPQAEETEEEYGGLYRWINPFTFATNWSISTYRYWELSATSANMRVAEVLFVGRPSDATNASSERYIVPASVVSATPDTGETAEEARAKAEALLDAQPSELPSEPVSSYDTFTEAEFYSLLTVTEMRVGDRYTTDLNNRDTSVYHAESVYNVLGMDLVALGTTMFGVSPFGLRFMPMLFSFAVLVLGFFFVRNLFKSDRAGFIFALLYALCDFSFSLGHVGTPLTAGLFFLLLAAYLVDVFYRKGMRRVGFKGLAPLIFGGLASAAAICVNGAMLIPVVGVCALYVAAMIRQQKANRYYLDKAVAECEAKPAAEDGTKDTGAVAKVLNENRYKNLSAGFVFPVALILGTVIFSLLFILPVYYPLVKFYDDPASPTSNVFSLGWKAFIGGFVGVNELGSVPSAWSVFLTLFKGTGEAYAVTAVVINAVAAVCGLIGLAYAVYKIVTIARNFSEQGKDLRRIVPLVCGLVLSLIAAACGGGTLGFIFLAYIFSFMLAAYAADDCMKREGKAGLAAKIVTITALVLLLVCFALFAIFTFSVPLPASFMGKFF